MCLCIFLICVFIQYIGRFSWSVVIVCREDVIHGTCLPGSMSSLHPEYNDVTSLTLALRTLGSFDFEGESNDKDA